MPGCEPTYVGDVELDQTLPALAGAGRTRARLLVWLHSRPLGEVELSLVGGRATADQVRHAVWDQLGAQVRAHLAADRLDPVEGIPPGGLPSAGPPCLIGSAPAGEHAVTVVVATRDRNESLRRTLGSLALQDHRRYDVVVVDSAPTGDSARSVALGGSWPFEVRYLRTDVPGLAVAHNTSLPFVTGDIVAFTDDDVVADRRWVSSLSRPFDDPAVTCVTGLLVPGELETPAQLLVEQGGGYGRGFATRRFSLDHPDGSALFPFTAGRFGSGANMAFRTGWLRASGGFDQATGAGTPARGGDDLVAFARVVLDGGTLVYEPSAVVRHWHRRDYEGLRRQAYGYGVGLGAYLSATLSRDPSLLPAMAARVPAGLAHLLGPSSPKNSDKLAGYPRELTWRERTGLVVGPWCYARSRWRYRRLPRDLASVRGRQPDAVAG